MFNKLNRMNQLFTDDINNVLDNNIIMDELNKKDWYNDILIKIKNNIELSSLETNLLWSNDKTFVPKNKNDLRTLIKKYIKLNVNNFNFIDVSNITDMSDLCIDFNFPESPDLSKWDVSNVTNMQSMFYGNNSVKTFGISNWDVSNVTNMCSMFMYCEKFNEKIDKWNTSKVEYMDNMFHFCWEFNSYIGSWDVSNVKNMTSMFSECHKFASDLSNWNVSNVTNMSSMFYNCKMFLSDLSKWNVSNVKYMPYIFYGCKFMSKADIKGWDLRTIENDYNMFYNYDSYYV